MFLYRAFLVLSILTISLPALAQTPQFFSTLPDIPVMLGLEEIAGETISFDKPQGRIIEISALTSQTPQAILRFYKDSLPQFGWVQISQKEFFRKDEYLVFDFSQVEQDGIVKIMIKPSL